MKTLFSGAILSILFFLPLTVFGLPGHVLVQRQYPIPNAFEVPTVSNIGITARGAFDPLALTESNEITVTGSHSGSHVVEFHLSDDHATLLIHPVIPFDYDEVVQVFVRARLLGHAVFSDSFQFRTMRHAIASERIAALRKHEYSSMLAPADIQSSADTMPPMTVIVDNGATPGTIYFSNFSFSGAKNNTFLFNLDEHGQIQKLANRSHASSNDLKTQPNGTITFFSDPPWMWYGMDSAWNVIDTFPSANGYSPDEHELRVFPDGGYALLAVSITTLDSSQWVPGMDSEASIGGDVIQIFDAHGNETFEWRGIDHYRVADAIHQNLADTTIDFEHANSLDFDSVGNILISNRHLCELTQIDRQTGAMIWRFGGAHNQFQLIGDSIWFSYQHYARWLPDGHLTLFDNSNFDSVYNMPHDSGAYVHESRALEYILDTNAKTATLVWQFHHTPETFTVAMGSVERLPNGNTFIGWGLNTHVAMTEVRPDNSTVFELRMDSGNVSYRAVKNATSLSSVKIAPAPSTLNMTVSSEGVTILAGFILDRPVNITLRIFDVLGREVEPVVSRLESAGIHSIPLDTRRLGTETYYCELRLADGTTAARSFAIAN
jgi:hypothetical protein